MSHEGAAPVSLLDPLICFCRAHGRDTQTGRPRYMRSNSRIFTLCIAMRAKNYNERQNWMHHFNMNRTKLVVNASSLLLATPRARCVRARLPSPRALRRSAYINQCDGQSAGKHQDGLCNDCNKPETVS